MMGGVIRCLSWNHSLKLKKSIFEIFIGSFSEVNKPEKDGVKYVVSSVKTFSFDNSSSLIQSRVLVQPA
jgi:hypothetical protein